MILAGENVRVIKSEHIQDKPNKKSSTKPAMISLETN